MRVQASTSVCLLIVLLCGAIAITSAQTTTDSNGDSDDGGNDNNNGTITRSDVEEDIEALIACAMKTRTFSILITNITEFVTPFLVILNIRTPFEDLVSMIMMLLKFMQPLRMLELLLTQLRFFAF